MATSLPSAPSTANLDEGSDGVGEARSDLYDGNVAISDLLDALGALAQLALATSAGLETVAQAAGTPDELRVKVQSAGGILRQADGLRLDINGLSSPLSGSLASDDLVPVYDNSAGGTKLSRWSINSILTSLAGTGLQVSSGGNQMEAVGAIDQQIFTTSSTWTKPANGTVAHVRAWGGGGSGANRSSGGNAGGGGGGGYTESWLLLSDLGSTESVTIGAGGASQTGNTDGAAGDTSSFGSHLSAPGGGGGSQATGGTGVGGGGGGGVVNAGGDTSGTAGGSGGDDPLGSEGGTGSTAASGAVCGAGGAGVNSGNNAGTPGNALYGGAGGGATGSSPGSGGTSISGGDGGDGTQGTGPSNGAQPGGGGGGNETAGSSGAGGDGQVIVTVF